MKSSFKLFRIAGIDIGIHYTWLIIFALITWSLAQGFFPQLYPDWSTAVYWISGVVGALMLFVSVLLHELAHSLVARARGIPVKSITLFILGGVSNLEEEPEKPGVEFFMAIVGPMTSLVLAAVFYGLSYLPADTNSPVTGILIYLAIVNLFLGIFNLLPGFPLDGGRVLRSIIWGSTGSLIKATNIAARVGQGIGWAMIFGGIYVAFWVNPVSGIWMAFIGWFLNSAADANRKEVNIRERFSHIKVSELISPTTITIEPDTAVAEMVANIFNRQHGRAVPVCHHGQLVGIATITDVKKIPQESWGNTPVSRIMTSEPLYTVRPEDNLNTVMQMLTQHDINQVLIKRDGQCAGILGRADILQHLQYSRELGMPKR